MIANKTYLRRLQLKLESGSTLLEALVAILIFSIGILAIVGLQAASMRASADAKYRSTANLFADELIGQMWSSNRAPAAIAASFAGKEGAGGAAYLTWVARIEGALPVPDIAAYKPVAEVTQNGGLSEIKITVYWLAPGDNSSAGARKHEVFTTIQP